MRTQLGKLSRRESTKAERRFGEVLKQLHIPFRTKVRIGGREIDFLVGRYAIEIDCHDQDVQKNYLLVKEGYTPVHFSNNDVRDTEFIKNYLLQIYV